MRETWWQTEQGHRRNPQAAAREGQWGIGQLGSACLGAVPLWDLPSLSPPYLKGGISPSAGRPRVPTPLLLPAGVSRVLEISGSRLYSDTFPCWLLSSPISLGVFPRGQPLGPPHHQQQGCPSCSFRLPAWFRNPSPACPIPGFRVKPVLKVLAGIRKPSYLPIEAMPPLHHPNNIQNAGQVSRSAMRGTCQ